MTEAVKSEGNDISDAKVLANAKSLADSLENLVTGFGTFRDKTSNTNFVFQSLNVQQLDTAYRSDWIARKVVNIPATDATREWREWQAEDDQITAIETEEKRLQLKQKTRRALIKARLYGGAVMVMGINGEEPSAPVNLKVVKQGSLQFIHTFSRYEINTGPLVSDPRDPLYGTPAFYEISTDPYAKAAASNQGLQRKPLQDGNGQVAKDAINPLNQQEYRLHDPARGGVGLVRIHPSRVVRLLGTPLARDEGEGWGDSVLQAVDEAIKDTAITLKALANLIVDAKVDVIQVPGLMKSLATADYEQRLLRRFQLATIARTIMSTLILDKEESWTRSTTNFGPLPEAVKLYLLVASGAADIPATRLLGQSPAGLNATGESDVRNYYDMVNSEQENTLTPALVNLDEVLIRSSGITDDATINKIWYEWAPLWQLTEMEAADVTLKKAQAFAIHHDSGLIDPQVLAEGLVNQLIEDGVYPGMNINAVAAVEDVPIVSPTIPTPPTPVAPSVPDPSGPSEPPADIQIDKRTFTTSSLFARRDVTNVEELRKWFGDQGVTDLRDEMHVTVVRLNGKIDWTAVDDETSDESFVLLDGFPRALVAKRGQLIMLVPNAAISKRHYDILRLTGLTNSGEWPCPFIVISDGFTGDISKVKPYRGVLQLSSEIFEVIEGD